MKTQNENISTKTPRPLVLYKTVNTYQIILDIYPTSSDDFDISLEDSFSIVVLHIIKWLKRRIGEDVLKEHSQQDIDCLNAYPDPDDYADFQMKDANNIVIGSLADIKSFYWDEEKAWALRIIEPDNGAENEDFQDIKSAIERKGRSFITECSLEIEGEHLLMGVKITCKQPKDLAIENKVFRPVFMDYLFQEERLDITEHDVNKNYSLKHSKIIIINRRSSGECDDFQNNVVDNRSRVLPIVYCPEPDSELGEMIQEHLYNQLIGFCYFVRIVGTKKRGVKLFDTNQELDAEIKESINNKLNDGYIIVDNGSLNNGDYYSSHFGSYNDNDYLIKEIPYHNPFYNSVINNVDRSGNDELSSAVKNMVREDYIKRVLKKAAFKEIRHYAKEYMYKSSFRDFRICRFYLELHNQYLVSKTDDTNVIDLKRTMDSQVERISSLIEENTLLQNSVKSINSELTKVEESKERISIDYCKLEKELEKRKDEISVLKEKDIEKKKQLDRTSIESKYRISELMQTIIEPLLNRPKSLNKDTFLAWFNKYYNDTLLLFDEALNNLPKDADDSTLLRLYVMINYVSGCVMYRRGQISDEELRWFDVLNMNLSDDYVGSKEGYNKKKVGRQYYKTYNGESYELTRHLKHGNKGANLVRVYYCYYTDEESEKSILYPCQGHLPTGSQPKYT